MAARKPSSGRIEVKPDGALVAVCDLRVEHLEPRTDAEGRSKLGDDASVRRFFVRSGQHLPTSHEVPASPRSSETSWSAGRGSRCRRALNQKTSKP